MRTVVRKHPVIFWREWHVNVGEGTKQTSCWRTVSVLGLQPVRAAAAPSGRPEEET